MTSATDTLRTMLAAWTGELTDLGLEAALHMMKLAFRVSSEYRENIKDFTATYVFESKDGNIAASAVFANGSMEVLTDPLDAWDVNLTFKDVPALWKFVLFSRNDVLEALLENNIEVYGNLNYLYKFGYMFRDLSHRLNVFRSIVD